METTVLQAKNQLSALLRKVEAGEDVIIRRGKSGPMFRLVAINRTGSRSLKPNPLWHNKIAFKDEDIWASEWKETE